MRGAIKFARKNPIWYYLETGKFKEDAEGK